MGSFPMQNPGEKDFQWILMLQKASTDPTHLQESMWVGGLNPKDPANKIKQQSSSNNLQFEVNQIF